MIFSTAIRKIDLVIDKYTNTYFDKVLIYKNKIGDKVLVYLSDRLNFGFYKIKNKSLAKAHTVVISEKTRE